MSPSRITSERWGSIRRPSLPEPQVDVLVPTADRPAELAVTLSGLAAQDDPPFRVIISDQSIDEAHAPGVEAMIRLLRAQGRSVEISRHMPRRGIAEHRHHLLSQATADAVLFLDDDVWLEPGSLSRMLTALRELDCGFVGSAVQGLSYLDDRRPEQQRGFERWRGRVAPERLSPASRHTRRASLHRAANLAHVTARLSLPRRGWVPYKVAWVGACVMFDRERLVEAGGFDFWQQLPPEHAGEDVLAQWRVMERYGGAGIAPSGAVHLEAPTTLPERDVDAPAQLADARGRVS